MATKIYDVKPVVGSTVAFKPTASQALADIPATLTRVVARLADGDYLVSVEYARPVKYGSERLTRIDALESRLYRLGQLSRTV